ncbi:SMP-30/gluconolactonase/LRE family protein [Pseudochrobactrum sp. MP213Fo]|uniref:SMP-30/gluconolactonase/LRE family protein n=1 Tax=Pseudochrobactrum sp. MP213Fo TaxID=3022250 RepID=UPI003B9EFE90
MIYDDRICELGEGPLWHPLRKQLYWFDILGRRLLTRDQAGRQKEFVFGELSSAAGWLDETHLMIASETGLYRFNLETEQKSLLCALEQDNLITRSNDGRADPWGGFWIGTMGKKAEKDAGSIYRYYQGEITKLFGHLTIPNAICFSPDKKFAYFTDTAKRTLMRVRLNVETGFPVEEPSTLILPANMPSNPDGAVTDKDGRLLVAQWGSGQISVFSPEGQRLFDRDVPALHSSCPAFGGDDFKTVFVTSAREGLSAEYISNHSSNGMVFALHDLGQGRPEVQVHLG